jgi:hypothetical protein
MPKHNHTSLAIKSFGRCPRCDYDYAWHDGLYEYYPEDSDA